MLDSVCVRFVTRPGPDEDVKRAMGELKYAIEELAYGAGHLKSD